MPDTTFTDGVPNSTPGPTAGPPNVILPPAVYAQLGVTSPNAAETAIVAAAIIRAAGMIRRHLQYDPVLAERTEIYPQQNHSDIYAGGTWEANQSQAYFRRFAIQGQGIFHVRHLPVRSIAHLYVDYDARNATNPSGAFGPTTELTEGSEWWANYDALDSQGNKICRDGAIRNIGNWPVETGSVKIVYTSGYTADELAGTDTVIDASMIAEAVKLEAVRASRRALLSLKNSRVGYTGRLTAERMGDYNYSADFQGEMDFGAGTLSAEAREMLSEFVNYGFSISP